VMATSQAFASNCDFYQVQLSEPTLYKMKVDKLESGLRGALDVDDMITSLSSPTSKSEFPIENIQDFLDINLNDQLVTNEDCISVGELFTIKTVLPGTYQLHFNTAQSMNKTFVRVEGYFEAASEDFFCSIFDYEDFRKWWEYEYGGWSFERETTGLNFPGSILLPFQDISTDDPRCGHSQKFKNLSSMEALVANIFSSLALQDYYLIITNDDYNEGTVDHEIAHALFYIDSQYKQSSLSELNKLKDIQIKVRNDSISAFEKLENIIGPGHLDYHTSVWEDEMQAFLGSNWQELFCEGHEAAFKDTDLKYYYEAILALQGNYKKTLERINDSGRSNIQIKQRPISGNNCP